MKKHLQMERYKIMEAMQFSASREYADPYGQDRIVAVEEAP